MSPAEIWWRVRGQAQSVLDLSLAVWRTRPVPPRRIAGRGPAWSVRAETLGRELPRMEPAGNLPAAYPAWRVRLLDRAERIARHRITLFDLEDHDLGPDIDWNYEYKARRKAPLTFAPGIDYRDHGVTGDCKFVWEINRHYHLVTLGRAYRVSGERAFAREVLDQIDDWIDQCPFGMGMNWRSPLELAIRMINWVWALELIRPSGMITGPPAERILGSVYRHLWEISRKYSQYSSANNHLIGEAAGVFIASSYFAGLRDGPRWRRQSREILLREIDRQTYPDGGNREQAFGYHLFVLEFFLLAGLAARNCGEDFDGRYWNCLERSFEFLCGLVEGGEHAPMLGDADDGYVLDLGGGRPSTRELLSVGAALFGRGDFRAEAGAAGEQVYWLLGNGGIEKYEGIRVDPSQASITSRAFPASGYYLLQSGRRGSADRLSVGFDCGELGLGAIAAHGHADALSVTLRAFGDDILVDPGTYDYFTYPEWRRYFRSTRAHNTVEVDGQDSSEMLGSFLWGRRAQARCLRWETTPEGACVSGEHDGYAASKVVHRRHVRLEYAERRVTIQDELTGTGEHQAVWSFHFAEHCRLRDRGGGQVEIQAPGGVVLLELDPALNVSSISGGEDPPGGWVSRGYHRKAPATTLRASLAWQGRASVTARLRLISP